MWRERAERESAGSDPLHTATEAADAVADRGGLGGGGGVSHVQDR